MPAVPEALRVSDFDYALPDDLIAQTPLERRDASRLMVVHRESGRLEHRTFSELDSLLDERDVVIANRSRVLPARLVGVRKGFSARVEILLLRRVETGLWEAFLRPGRRLREGAEIEVSRGGLSATVVAGGYLSGGRRLVRVPADTSDELLEGLGSTPLPPYIQGWRGDDERYQTVYADRPGSVAAPTAGLHFTPQLLERIRARGVRVELVTLHVGADTFRPIKSDAVSHHEMHAEWAEVPERTLAVIAEARRRGGRAVAVGTTTARALESAAVAGPPGRSWSGWTSLFIAPGYQFKLVDALVTNFHLPKSTLLLLVSAFAGREHIMKAYAEAVRRRYRFYSFGDAMFLSP